MFDELSPPLSSAPDFDWSLIFSQRGVSAGHCLKRLIFTIGLVFLLAFNGLVFLLILGYDVLLPKAARSIELHLLEGIIVVGHLWTESCVVLTPAVGTRVVVVGDSWTEPCVILPPAVGTVRTHCSGRMGMTLLQSKVVEILNTPLFLLPLQGRPKSIPFGSLLLVLQLSGQLSGPLSGRTRAVPGQLPSLVTSISLPFASSSYYNCLPSIRQNASSPCHFLSLVTVDVLVSHSFLQTPRLGPSYFPSYLVLNRSYGGVESSCPALLAYTILQ